MPPLLQGRNPVTPTLPRRKRKRDLDDNMDRENQVPNEAVEAATNGSSFFSPIIQPFQTFIDWASSPFKSPARSHADTTVATGASPKHNGNKRLHVDTTSHLREETPTVIPGAFPISPTKGDHSAAPLLPMRSSSRRNEITKSSDRLERSRVGTDHPSKRDEYDVSRREAAKPLPRPNPYAPPLSKPGMLFSEQKRTLHVKHRYSALRLHQGAMGQSPLLHRAVLGTARNFPAIRPPKVQKQHDTSLLTPSSGASREFRDSSDAQDLENWRDNQGTKAQATEATASLDHQNIEELIEVLDLGTQPKRSKKLEKKDEWLKKRKILEKEREAEKLRKQKEETLRKRGVSPGLQQALLDFAQEYQEKRKSKAEEEERRKTQPKAVAPKPVPVPAFVRLPSKEALDSLPDLATRNLHDEIHVYGKTPVKRHDFNSVQPYEWLNDSIINAWFDDLCRQARTKFEDSLKAKGASISDGVPRYHAFNTSWYPTATEDDGKGINKVMRWAKRANLGGANLLKAHKIFIPCYVGNNHWTLLVVLPQRHLVRYYDSFNGSAMTYLEATKEWISSELKNINAWDENDWTFEAAKSSFQQNGSDCGVYTSMNAFATFYNENPTEIVPSVPMETARKLMIAILLSGGFRAEFDLEKWYPGFRLETDRVVMNGTH